MADYELIHIEDFFNEQRAKARWPYKRLDCADWSFMAAWQKDGVPFAVICRGIEEVFANHLRRNAPGKINSVRYCEDAIKKHWKDHSAAHVGGHDNPAQAGHEAEFGVERITTAIGGWMEALQELSNQLSHGSENIPTAVAIAGIATKLLRLSEVFTSDPDLEKLDSTLAQFEQELMATIIEHAEAEKLADLKRRGEKEFAKYKDTWMPGMWDQTIQNFIHKSLREEYHIPRLSLFYL